MASQLFKIENPKHGTNFPISGHTDYKRIISGDFSNQHVFNTLQIFIVILSCKSIKVMGKMYKLMIGKILRKNYP